MSLSEDVGLLTLGQTRIFLQENGISPASDFYYHGSLTLGGLTESQGELTPIYLPDPSRHGSWIVVGYTRGVTGLPTSDFTARMAKDFRDIWWKLRQDRCPINAQILVGDCNRPDDFTTWEAKILLNSMVPTDLSLPAINPMSGDEEDVANFSGSLMMLSMDRILPLNAQEYAETALVAEALDGFYKGDKTCGSCGTQDDGCNALYVLTKANAGSPGLSSQILYTRDDKSSWVSRDIPTLGGKSGTKVVSMGKYILVISEADGAHHVISYTNLHANATAQWNRVSTNYVAGGAPRAIYRLSSNRAIIVGQGGYIYRIASPTSAPTVVSDGSITTQRLNAIDGLGSVIVAGGDTGALVVSQNKGTSFALVPIVDDTGATLTGDVTAVAVIDKNQWFIGIDGSLYMTIDGGSTFTLHPQWNASVSVINHICFVDRQVGYIAAELSGAGTIYRTDSVGSEWSNEAPAIDNIPAAVRYNFVAPCFYNEVSMGGLAADADGVLAVAQ